MTPLFNYLTKKMSMENALLCFIFSHIFLWFFAGAAVGILLALLLSAKNMMLVYAVTSGAFFSITLGYIYGYIIVLKNT